MMPARDIHGLLQARAGSGRIGFQISESVFEKIIDVLRQRFGISYLEAELLSIDIAREHERALYAVLHNRLSLDEVLDVVHLYLEGDE